MQHTCKYVSNKCIWMQLRGKRVAGVRVWVLGSGRWKKTRTERPQKKKKWIEKISNINHTILKCFVYLCRSVCVGLCVYLCEGEMHLCLCLCESLGNKNWNIYQNAIRISNETNKTCAMEIFYDPKMNCNSIESSETVAEMAGWVGLGWGWQQWIIWQKLS